MVYFFADDYGFTLVVVDVVFLFADDYDFTLVIVNVLYFC